MIILVIDGSLKLDLPGALLFGNQMNEIGNRNCCIVNGLAINILKYLNDQEEL